MQSCMKLQWTDVSGVEIMSEVLRFLKTTHVIILKKNIYYGCFMHSLNSKH